MSEPKESQTAAAGMKRDEAQRGQSYTEVTQQFNGTAGASVLVFGLQSAQGGILEPDRAL